MSPIICGDKEMMECAAIWYGVFVFLAALSFILAFYDHAPLEFIELREYKGKVLKKYNVIIKEEVYESSLIVKPGVLGVINAITEQFGVKRIHRIKSIHAEALRKDTVPYAVTGHYPYDSTRPYRVMIMIHPFYGYKSVCRGYFENWQPDPDDKNGLTDLLTQKQIGKGLELLANILPP